MSPITKVWFCSLQPGHSISEPAFVDIWNETLGHCTSYTKHKTSGSSPEMHILYQCETDPTQLALITGYPSLEMNLEADRAYLAVIAKRMSEFVKHQSLMMFNIDVKELPLSEDHVTIVEFDDENTGKSPGIKVQDCWLPPSALAKNPPEEKHWWAISNVEQARELNNTGYREAWTFRRVMGQ